MKIAVVGFYVKIKLLTRVFEAFDVYIIDGNNREETLQDYDVIYIFQDAEFLIF